MNKRLQRYRMVLPVLAVVCGVMFTYTRLQGQSGNSQKIIPSLPMAPLSTVPTPPVPGLSQYIRSQTAAIALGKALFWDQQVGSDGVQACASCHFNAGADSRAINQVDPGLRDKDPTSAFFDTFTLGVLTGIGFSPNYQLHAGTPTAGFGGYHDGDFPLHKPLSDLETFPYNTGVDHHDVISSQGVFPTKFNGLNLGSSVEKTTLDTDAYFFYPPDPADPTSSALFTRRVPPRNTPSAINAVFNYRNFWDGRARNICNGANPFGERDAASHVFFASTTSATPIAALVRLQNSALCSQALGPPGSNFEMSGAGRNFRDIGRKMLLLDPLSDTGGPLGAQLVDSNDSVLGKNSKSPKKGINISYGKMIQAAFQPAWWQSVWRICIAADGSETLINPTVTPLCPDGTPGYSQMEYNFSLFWGIAIQAYESTLRADQTPFDKYLSHQIVFTVPADNVTSFFSFQLKKPVTPGTVSVQAFNPSLDVSDQDVFAFDDGFGRIFGVGIAGGGINYSTGQVQLSFELPPPTGFPTRVAYSVGSTPLTAAQLHGLLIFETKGKCIVCHGGPELTNASVAHEGQTPMERMIMGDFTIRVYDSGFYHIGTRPAHEDIGLADFDGIASSGLPLSDAATAQKQVCDPTAPGFPISAPIIPGRRGDGIPTAPLNCNDQIAQRGMVKAPGLRNLALTAPYFHNGGQLTLEQVVEFYDRGGDFGLPSDEKLKNTGVVELLPDGTLGEPVGLCDPTTALLNCLMDPNVEVLGLSQQEKVDLVDFLRNGLLDQRTLIQSAPFDHPSLTVPNGHAVGPNGYPVPDPNHPGQALDQYMAIPATGKSGGLPLPTFLQNLARP
jgi:cytochrome c peroxidase